MNRIILTLLITSNIFFSFCFIQNSFAQTTGSIKVIIDPAEAANAGAKWRVFIDVMVGWTPWFDSGNEISGFRPGETEIEFNNISGWQKPPNQYVFVEIGQTVDANALYSKLTPSTGSIKIWIEPSEAVGDGARWRGYINSFVGWSPWFESGEERSGFEPGETEIEFNSIPGWDSPENSQVDVVSGQTVTLTSIYQKQTVTTGSIKVMIEPDEAINRGAKWRAFINSSVCWTSWFESGEVVEGFEPNETEIEFSEITGYDKPFRTNLKVTSEQIITLYGKYYRRLSMNSSYCIGNDYEQFEIYNNTGIQPPVVSIEGATDVDEGESIYLNAVADVDTSKGGKAFFYWCAEKGVLEYDVADFARVKYTAPLITEDEAVKISVRLGDGLGYIDTEIIVLTIRDNDNFNSNDPSPILSVNHWGDLQIGEPLVVSYSITDSNLRKRNIGISGNLNSIYTDIYYKFGNYAYNEVIKGLREDNGRYLWYPPNGIDVDSIKIVSTDGNSTTIKHIILNDNDTDQDGLADAWEMSYFGGLDQDATSDFDNDGLPNGWEQEYGFDPTDPNTASLDLDEDGYTNLEEYNLGTDPTNPNDPPCGTTNPGNNDNPKKVTICHKGHTITISRNALQAHLNHGDTIGPCPADCETSWMRMEVGPEAEAVLYDPDGTEIGEFAEENGNQSLVMLGLPSGDYRIVFRGRIDGKGKLKINAKKGNGDIIEIEQEVDLKKHRVMKTILRVDPATGEIVAEDPRPSMKPDGTPLNYDYDGDDDIDINDIEKVEAVWNICRGEGLYNAFFDIDEDGCITVSDIMKVSSEYFVP